MIKGIKEACNKTTAIGGKRLSEVGRKTEKKQFDWEEKIVQKNEIWRFGR